MEGFPVRFSDRNRVVSRLLMCQPDRKHKIQGRLGRLRHIKKPLTSTIKLVCMFARIMRRPALDRPQKEVAASCYRTTTTATTTTTTPTLLTESTIGGKKTSKTNRKKLPPRTKNIAPTMSVTSCTVQYSTVQYSAVHQSSQVTLSCVKCEYSTYSDKQHIHRNTAHTPPIAHTQTNQKQQRKSRGHGSRDTAEAGNSHGTAVAALNHQHNETPTNIPYNITQHNTTQHNNTTHPLHGDSRQ